MSQLAPLRSQLRSLRRRQLITQWAAGLAILAIGLTWAFLALYAIDVAAAGSNQKILDLPQRCVLIALASIGLVWVYLRLARPYFQRGSRPIEIALQIEHHHELENDLVAALQFEAPSSATKESPQLEQAVIDQAATLGDHLDLQAGFSQPLFRWRLIVLLVSLAFVSLIGWRWPDHLGTFLNHLTMGSKHYPTQCEIVHFSVNHQIIALAPQTNQPIASPFGQPVRFELLATGELPDHARIELRPIASGEPTIITLTRQQLPQPMAPHAVEQSRPAAVPASKQEQEIAEHEATARSSITTNSTEPTGQARYVGQLPRLLQPVRLQAYLGDAYTDEILIQVVPLPLVQPELQVIRPAYAREAEPSTSATGRGALQVEALQGSHITLALAGSNKPLQHAWLSVVGQADRIPLVPTNEARTQWRLPETGTPLANIEQPLRFTLDVTDEDGLHLASPLRGEVRIQADRPPLVQARLIHQKVHPHAQPVIDLLSLDDDHGIGQLRVVLRIFRNQQGNATTAPTIDPTAEEPETSETPEEPEEHWVTIDRLTQVLPPRSEESSAPRSVEEPIPFPLTRRQLPLTQRGIAIDLKPYRLQPGDKITMTVEVADYRGDRQSETSFSEPFVVEVAEASEVWEEISQADELTEQQLTELINELLGEGDSP